MIKIIPAIDLIGGKCVRLTKGDYHTKKEYNDDPVGMARYFESQGVSTLHIVDLEAAAGNIDAHHDIIKEIIGSTALSVQIGGGIRTIQQVETLINIGAEKVIVGSTAYKKRKEVAGWISALGGEHIIIGADVSERMIAVDGWQKTSDELITDFIKYYLAHGGQEFLCTDISKDGMLQGPSIPLYKDLVTLFPASSFIASGGVTTEKDIDLLIEIGMQRIIVGKAIYEGRLEIKQLIEKYELC